MTYFTFITVLIGPTSPHLFSYPVGHRRILRKDELDGRLVLQIMIYLHLQVLGINFCLLPFSQLEVEETILEDPVVREPVRIYRPCLFGTQPCLSISFRSTLGTVRPAVLKTRAGTAEVSLQLHLSIGQDMNSDVT